MIKYITIFIPLINIVYLDLRKENIVKYSLETRLSQLDN